MEIVLRLLPVLVLSLVVAGCTHRPAPAPAPTSAWKPFSVADFGAKGDGATDDTDAIQRCITTAEQSQSAPYYHADNAYPEVVFPSGRYRISRTLIVAATEKTRNLALRGLGSATLVQSDPEQDILYFHHGYRQSVEGLGFSGGRIQLRFFSRNMNRAQLLVRDCRFADAGSYAVDDALKGPHWLKIVAPYTVTWQDGLPRGTSVDVDNEHDIYFTSTVLHLDRCEFLRCRNVARLFADWGMITRCRIVTHPEMRGAAIYSRGVLKISDTQVRAQTQPGRQQRFVDNLNGGVMLDRVTIEADGPGLCAIYNRRPYDNGGLYNVYAIIDRCRIQAGGSAENSWVYCEEIPNLIRISDSTELSGTPVPAVAFRQPVTPEALRRVNFPELVQRLPKLAQIFGYEAGMPRVFAIEDWKLPLNFAFSIHGNRGLIETLPAALQPHLKGPLPAAVREGFAPLAQGGDLEAPAASGGCNVVDFGAAGDGKQDDSDALQAALAAAAGQPQQEVLVPGGRYRLTRTLDLPPAITLRGLGLAVFLGDSTNTTLFRGRELRRAAFVSIGFHQAAMAADLQTAAREKAEILFDRCTFSKISGVAVRGLAGRGETREANRTRLRITDSVFGLAGHALESNVSDALFDYNWLSLYDHPVPGALVNRGTLRVLDVIGVPDNSQSALWVENHGTLIMDNMRFGGEGQFPKDLVSNRDPAGRIFLRYSWLCCHGGTILRCETSPAFAALTDNLGCPDPKQNVLVTLLPGARGAVTDFLFERGNIAPLNIVDQRSGPRP